MAKKIRYKPFFYDEYTLILQKLLKYEYIETTINTYTTIFDKYKNNELEKLELYFSKFVVAVFVALQKEKCRKSNVFST